MLFIYGTLQDADILHAVLGHHTPLDTARAAHAPGWRAIRYPGRPYPALVPAPGDAAPGLLLFHLSAQDLHRLDAFEGDEYRRMPITITLEGTPAAAQAYLPTRSLPLVPQAWSLARWTTHRKPAMLAQTRQEHAR